MTGVFTSSVAGPVTLRNRIVRAATFEGRTHDALVTDALIDFHSQHAHGGVGMTTVAFCAVSPEGARTANRSGCAPRPCRDCGS